MARTKIDLSQIAGIKSEESLLDTFNRIETNNQRIICFVLSGTVNQGLQSPEIRFPFSGTITGVYASCRNPGNSDTIIEVQKCSQQSIDSALESEWESIFSQNLIIESNNKSSNTSALKAVIATPDVNLNDHFRINILESGQLSDLTIEIEIKTY